MVTPKSDDFRKKLAKLFASATEMGFVAVDVNAGNLHRRVGGYPDGDHRMPICCEVMRQAIAARDEIVDAPPSGKGARLTVRYRLPRPKGQ